MKILLIDIDSKIPNFALKKIEKYHRDRGDHIEWNFPLYKNQADKIYVSCIFTWNKCKATQWKGIAEIGGTGYSIEKKLPPEIDKIIPIITYFEFNSKKKVRINLGRTTRGCIRNCGFCIVPKRNEKFRIECNNIEQIWDRKSKVIKLLDDNILVNKKHFISICNQILKLGIYVDFNQGLDIRLLNDEVCYYLKKIKHYKQYKFAWDEMYTEKVFIEKLKLLLKYINASTIMIYMLINYNTNLEEDMYRLIKIKEFGCDPFVMIYDKQNCNRLKREFAQWNNRFYFRNLSFEDYLKARKTTDNYQQLRDSGKCPLF